MEENKQLHDSGAVIGYRPTLEYIKEQNATATLTTTSNDVVVADDNGSAQVHTLSPTLSTFKKNLPSNAIEDIEYTSDSIDNLIQDVSELFTPIYENGYNDIDSFVNALKNGNKDYAQEFLNAHKYSITGSIIPEIIEQLFNTKQGLDAFKETYKKLYYNDGYIPTSEAKAIDNAFLNQLQTYESTNAINNINYLVLAYDSSLNMAVSNQTFILNQQCSDFANCINDIVLMNQDLLKQDVLEYMYEESNKELAYRESSFKVQQNIAIMQKTLYNYYNKRRNVAALYYMYDGDIEFPFYRKMDQYKTQIDESVRDVAKVFAGNTQYLHEMAIIEKEKCHILENYSQIAYK